MKYTAFGVIEYGIFMKDLQAPDSAHKRGAAWPDARRRRETRDPQIRFRLQPLSDEIDVPLGTPDAGRLRQIIQFWDNRASLHLTAGPARVVISNL
jgi:hypothetical protein